MKKITLRTKITLTIAGLLAMAGVFYAANPTSFAPVLNGGPIGVAAAPADLLVTEYCSQNVDTIGCSGNVSVLATIPGGSGCAEKYVSIAPSQSANAGFTPRDVFVTQGAEVYKVSEGSVTLFATIGGCAEDHTGITFDHAGTFGYNMIVTCQNGGVWKVDASGAPAPIADLSTNLEGLAVEGPAIPPLSFGPLGGQILVADENYGQVHAISNTGTVTYDVFDWYGAEGVIVIPSAPCSFCSSGGAFFQADESSGAIYQYPLTDFTGLAGGILITSEFGAGTASITFNGTDYNQGFFDNIPGALYEGSAWADCDVPTPTPTATATATPTATATATVNATATPTATIAPTSLTVTAATGTYGGTSTTFTATLTRASDNSPLANVTINFTLNGNFAGSATTNIFGEAKSNAVLLVGSSYNAGLYPTGAAASFAGDASFGASHGTNSLTVNKVSLLVSADNKSRIYGSPNPPLTGVYTGFVNNEGDTHGPFASSGVTGTPTLSTTASQFSPVGQYPITIAQGTLTGGNNYDITLAPGTLTVYLSGIIGLNKVTIGASSALVDSYDSSQGLYSQSNQSADATVISNGTITLQGAKVHGDMVAGGSVTLQANSAVTGDVLYGTTISVASSATVGSSTHQSTTFIQAPIPNACGSYTKPPTTGNQWITGVYTYDATKGNLTVSGGGTATLASGTYCFNNVTVSGGSTLAIQQGATVIMNVTGKFTDSGGSLQNNSYIPFNLQVSSSYTGSNGVTVSGTSATYMSIYAPGTDVTISGGGPLYGSLLGKTLTISGNSFAHQDLALPGWSLQ